MSAPQVQGLRNSPFGRLAPELRVEIWKHLFAGGYFAPGPVHPNRIRYSYKQGLAKSIAVLHLCRLAREEAMPYFLANPVVIEKLGGFRDHFPPSKWRVSMIQRTNQQIANDFITMPFPGDDRLLKIRLGDYFDQQKWEEELSNPRFVGETAYLLQAVVRSFQPRQVEVAFSIAYHRTVGGAWHYHWGKDTRPSIRASCTAGAPSFHEECGALAFKLESNFTVEECTQVVKRVCEITKQCIEAHAQHSRCSIKVESKAFLAGLKVVRKAMLRVAAGFLDILELYDGTTVGRSGQKELTLPDWAFPKIPDEETAQCSTWKHSRAD